MRNIKINSVRFHILIWIGYWLYVYFINKIASDNVGLILSIIILLPFIALFYMILYGLEKTRDKILLRTIYLLGTFLFFTIVAYSFIVYILPYFGIIITKEDFSISKFIQSIILEYIKFLSYAVLFFVMKELLDKEKKVLLLENENNILEIQKIQSEKEKLQYKYAFLRSQINPHFLYNTLNLLYSQAIPLSDKLADNIIILSKLMRYSLDNLETENMSVSLEKEIEGLEMFLQINRARFQDSKFIKYEKIGFFLGYIIPPLSLITIVENAFKYGDLSDEKYPLEINLNADEKEMIFTCTNKKKINNTNAISHNIGLDNIKQRLEFVLENKYEINITDEKDFYTFELKILPKS